MPAARLAPASGHRPHLELALACVGGATRLVRCASRAPLRVFRAVKPAGPGAAGGFGADGAGAGVGGAGGVTAGAGRPDWLVEVPIVHLGGGLLPGESLNVAVRVGAGAAARFTGVGATHLHPPPEGAGGQAAQVRLALEVEAGALAEWVPEPLVPHAGARYRQVATVVLHPGASLFYAESLVVGRSEEEAFSWDELVLRTKIVAPDRTLLAVDALRLAPRPGTREGFSPGLLPGAPPNRSTDWASFGGYRALAGVLVVAEGALLDRLETALGDLFAGPSRGEAGAHAPWPPPASAYPARSGVLGGMSRLPGGAGLAVRLLAPGGGAAMAAIGVILARWHRLWRQGRHP